MIRSDERLKRILKQEPELAGLRHEVKRRGLVFSPDSLPADVTDIGERGKYIYTFFAATGGGGEMEIKVTVDKGGEVLKLITSK
ncbi:MAG: hypothetical protein GY949_05805 [Gammaproteobacteria bacterium]|nr:hypothetical protein [Gammaproteobacteria bacterium]